MGDKTHHHESGGYQKTSLTIEVEVLAYELNPNSMNGFKRFYDETIRPWLAKNRVPETYAWIVGNYLIVVALQFMPPWIGKDGIPGLEQFLKQQEPVHMQPLRELTLSPETAAAGYAETKSA